jgi:PAS domain S-box-containing protein
VIAFPGAPAGHVALAAAALLGVPALVALAAVQFRLIRIAVRTREAYRLLLESAEDMIFTLDGEGCFRAINDAAVRQSGYTREELLGRAFAPYIVPEDVSCAMAQFAAAIQGEPRQYEARYVRKDGSVRWIWCTNTPIRENGTITGVLAIARDVTDRRLLEAQLQYSQKMEAVGRLACGVAHDFNNLLTAISANAELALSALSTEDRACSEVEEIRRVTARGAALTRQLLAFSRTRPVRPVVVDVGSIVTGLSQLLQRLIGENIEMKLATEPGACHVRADPGQLEQAIVNLAVNARDAMPEGGLLVIAVDNCTLSEPLPHPHGVAAAGEYVRLEVKDIGAGMTAAVQERIFEPFFTTKERSGGTGLGLSTVYGIVKRLGGHIIVESQPGEGTRFQILLPREDALPASGTDRRAESTATSRPATILLVEDDPAVLEPVRRMLEQVGHEVLWACGPDDALRAVDSYTGRIDLLLTDVVLPGMSGRALADLAGERRPDMAVLFMSGYAEGAAARRTERPGPRQLLRKPFTGDVLLRTVHGVLE